MADMARLSPDSIAFRRRLREQPPRVVARTFMPSANATSDIRPIIQPAVAQPVIAPQAPRVTQPAEIPITVATPQPPKLQPIQPPQPIAKTKIANRDSLVGKQPVAQAPAPAVLLKLPLVSAQPYAKPAAAKQQPSQVLRRSITPTVNSNKPSIIHDRPLSLLEKAMLHLDYRQYSTGQATLVAMAAFVFFVGLFVSIQTLQTNNNTTAQVSALSKEADTGTTDTASSNPASSSTPPSTVKPTAAATAQYAVAPDLPKYLSIPKLGVHARVLQVSVKSNGELATPSNVFDTAWYSGSAKPGQPGATLIDGHVSSWTAHGVFYSIKTLTAGDALQITRGDGSVVNYRVVKTQAYDADHVDMQAAISPVTNGKSGLNLITCGGKVKPGTSEFTQRTIVFAEQQ